MPSNPLKPSKAKAKRRAWQGQRPGRHPCLFSGIKSARSPEDTCVTRYEFSSYRSTRRINPVQELTGSTPKANLLTGLGVDETFSRTDASGARHLLTDALGSTLALTDGTGAVQTRYSYEPYGKTTVSGTASSNSFEYTGRENDSTGLYFYRARYYNPGLQRFVSEDPIGLAAGANVFAYVGGNPVSFVDPYGLASEIPNPNGVVPGGPWTPNPANNPGSFDGPKPSNGGGRPQCQYVPPAGEGGPPGSKGYWKTQQPGQGWGQRYDANGNPITPNQAHPGSPRPPIAPITIPGSIPFYPLICPLCNVMFPPSNGPS